jgi:hypothetical protein
LAQRREIGIEAFAAVAGQNRVDAYLDFFTGSRQSSADAAPTSAR